MKNKLGGGSSDLVGRALRKTDLNPKLSRLISRSQNFVASPAVRKRC